MTKVKKKNRVILLIIGLLSIIIGLIIFTTIINNYRETTKFIKNAEQVKGFVYNVRRIKNDKYSFEYKYRVNNKDYKKFVSSMKFEDGLKENDSIIVYYSKEKVNLNTIKKPSVKTVYIAILFLIIFVIIGVLNIVKYFKK